MIKDFKVNEETVIFNVNPKYVYIGNRWEWIFPGFRIISWEQDSTTFFATNIDDWNKYEIIHSAYSFEEIIKKVSSKRWQQLYNLAEKAKQDFENFNAYLLEIDKNKNCSNV